MRSRVIRRPPKVDGRLLYAKNTPAGWVVVGGTGDNVYDGPLAFVLDLGGDDVYRALDVTPRLGNGIQHATTVERGSASKVRTLGRGIFVDK